MKIYFQKAEYISCRITIMTKCPSNITASPNVLTVMVTAAVLYIFQCVAAVTQLQVPI